MKIIEDITKNKRVAILPYPGDPFLLNYWINNFITFWEQEIDRLIIVCNTPAEQDVIDYIRLLCVKSQKIELIYVDHQIQHGDAINIALDKLQDEVVMLIEDDAYIFRSGIVDFYFKKIEDGEFDVIGSPRGSCSFEILERAKQIWGLSYDGEGDQGPNFWPNFFFAKAATLISTDRNFNSRAWEKGEKIHSLLDYDVEVPLVVGDTFVNTSLQLRSMIPRERILTISQYHASPDDARYYENKERYFVFDGRAPWIHIGSLSSGAGGALMDDHSRSLSRRKIMPEGPLTVLPKEWCDVTSEMQKKEWERRVAWWQKFWLFCQPTKGIQDFYNAYGRAIEQLINQYQLSRSRIREYQRIYGTLGL